MRWLRRILLVLVALALLARAALGHLEHPWVKGLVRAHVRASQGLEIDYARASVGLHQGSVEGLVIGAAGTELLRAREVRIDWSLADRRVERVDLREVTWTITVDDHGGTSLDRYLDSSAPVEGPSVRARALLARTRVFPEIRIEDLTLVIATAEARTALSGLAGMLDRTGARAGSAEHPLDLVLTDTRGVRVATHGFAELAFAPAEVSLVADLRTPGLGDDTTLVHAELAGRVDARAIDVSVRQLEVGADLVTGEGELTFPDDAPLVVRRARAEVDLPRVLPLVPAGLLPVPLAVEHGRALIVAEDVGPGPMPASAKLAMRASLDGAQLAGARLDDVTLAVEASGLDLAGRAAEVSFELVAGAVSSTPVRLHHVEARGQTHLALDARTLDGNVSVVANGCASRAATSSRSVPRASSGSQARPSTSRARPGSRASMRSSR